MLIRKIIIQFLGTIFLSFLSFLILSFTARFYGPKIMGEVNYYLSLLGLFLLFSDLGFSRAHVKFVSNKLKLSVKIGVFLVIKLSLLLVFLLSVLLYYFGINKSLSLNKEGLAFLILLLNEFFYRLASSLLLTFEGLKKVAIENLVLIFGRLSKFIVLIIFIFISKSVLGLSFTYLAEALVVFFLTFFFLKNYLPFAFDKNIFKQYFNYSLPFFVIYPFSYIQANMDFVILKNFWNTTLVGYYAATLGLANFLKTLYGVVITLFFPKISEIYSQEKSGLKIQTYTNLVSKYLLVFFLPLFFALHFFRKEIISLVLGQQFLPALNVFSFLLLGIFILMLSSPYDYVIYATSKHKVWMPLTIMSTFLLFVLELILVPERVFNFKMLAFKAEGVVLANIIVWFLSFLIQIYLIKKLLKISFYYKNFWLIFFNFIFLASGYLFCLFDKNLILRIFFYLIFLIFFYLLCFGLKIISLEDRKYFKVALNFKDIFREGIKEIKKG